MGPAIDLDRRTRQRKLRGAYVTRNGSTPWGLTLIEQAGMPTYIDRAYRHTRLSLWSIAVRRGRLMFHGRA